MSSYRYGIDICWSGEDDAFVASVPELPGCMADGPTHQDALAAAEVAIADWISVANEIGRTVPDPKAS